jgi:hypothetical protein
MTVKIGNPEALIAAMKFIENEPHRWDQAGYAMGTRLGPTLKLRHQDDGVFWDRQIDVEACGSTMCLAGTVAYQAGYLTDGLHSWLPGEEEDVRDTHDVAAEILGASERQADALFLDTGGHGSRPQALMLFKQEVSEITGVQFDD